MKGVFITFEGIEGSGKSTQANYLYTRLLEHGVDCVLTREPGGTELGDTIRDILLHTHKAAPIAELLLFLADRNQHVREIIQPYLDKGFVVISDRFYHSTYAYQISGRSIEPETVRALNEIAIEGCHPDLSFLVDITPETGFARKKAGSLQLDRIEQEDLEFHHSVRDAYIQMSGEEERLILIDGMQDRQDIREAVWKSFLAHFPRFSERE